REEVEKEREDQIAKLKKNSATLEAYLNERGETRREFDETLRKGIVRRKFLLASVGRNQDPNVRVRPVTDLYVPPGEVRKYYDRHQDRFHEPAAARYRMLTVRTDLENPDRKQACA